MDVCFYFQLHQPNRVRRYQVFDIGSGKSYFDDPRNKETLKRVAARCYLPASRILTQLARESDARVALSVSGALLDQLQTTAPEVIGSLQALVASGGVELLGETSHHSLASLENLNEFATQVELHRAMMKTTFGATPRVFRNTELIASDTLASRVAKMGFVAMLVEGADGVLGGQSPNHVYASKAAPSLRLLPRNYRLSDDVAFRFSAQEWDGWPLTADKYAEWIAASDGDVVNVFMDFETFGEHHEERSGILDFLRALPLALHRNGVRMVTPSDLAKRKPAGMLSYPTATSWADTERDTSAWLGNRLQNAAHKRLYELRDAVLGSGNQSLISRWRRLSTSDHFYYMSTKWHADGDVHTYFSPYATPYDAYISYMNVMRDLQQQLRRPEQSEGSAPSLRSGRQKKKPAKKAVTAKPKKKKSAKSPKSARSARKTSDGSARKRK